VVVVGVRVRVGFGWGLGIKKYIFKLGLIVTCNMSLLSTHYPIVIEKCLEQGKIAHCGPMTDCGHLENDPIKGFFQFVRFELQCMSYMTIME